MLHRLSSMPKGSILQEAKMTHDELLKRLWEKRNALCDNLDVHFALSAVVELHKPSENDSWGSTVCVTCPTWEYPCLTIQAIEKQIY